MTPQKIDSLLSNDGRTKIALAIFAAQVPFNHFSYPTMALRSFELADVFIESLEEQERSKG